MGDAKLVTNEIIPKSRIITIIARTLPNGLEKTKITATDKKDVKEWFIEGFELLINLGAIKGYEDGTIKPNNNVTKAEAAKILYTIL